MRPANQVLLLCWITAILDHSEALDPSKRDEFVRTELKKLEEDFSVVLVWTDNKVVLSFPF